MVTFTVTPVCWGVKMHLNGTVAHWEYKTFSMKTQHMDKNFSSVILIGLMEIFFFVAHL